MIHLIRRTYDHNGINRGWEKSYKKKNKWQFTGWYSNKLTFCAIWKRKIIKGRRNNTEIISKGQMRKFYIRLNPVKKIYSWISVRKNASNIIIEDMQKCFLRFNIRTVILKYDHFKSDPKILKSLFKNTCLKIHLNNQYLCAYWNFTTLY